VAISLVEKDLAIKIGEKYQKLVVMYLKSNFIPQPSELESAWLHAFNRHIMGEIKKCCI